MDDVKKKIAELLAGIDRGALYHSIGRFIFEFSQLEYALKHYLAELAGVRNESFTPMMAAFDYGRLCAACRVVYGDAFAGMPEATRLDELLVECQKINEDRLRVVHALWTIREGTGMAIHVSRTSFKESTYFDKPGELDQKADRLAKIREEISRLLLGPPFPNPS